MNTRRRFRVFSSITTAALALALAAGVASADRRDRGDDGRGDDQRGPEAACDHDRDHAGAAMPGPQGPIVAQPPAGLPRPPIVRDRDGRFDQRDGRFDQRDDRDPRDGRFDRRDDRDPRDGRLGQRDDRDQRRGRHARHRQAWQRMSARPMPPQALRAVPSKRR